MAKKRFLIHLHCYDAEIELDDMVIDVVDDEWRSKFYNLKTPEEIAAHIGFNLIKHEWELSSLDGWADQPDSNARIIYRGDWDSKAEYTITIETS